MRGVWPRRIGGQNRNRFFTHEVDVGGRTAIFFSVEAACQVYNQTDEFKEKSERI